jgi:diguanylate cyclase (GGDEF)-like protein/PAS domain S-box-containing protein
VTGRLLEDFAEIASDWFWEMDENLRFSYFSPRFEAATGASPGLLIGKSRYEVAANSDDPDHWQAHFDDLAARRPFRDFTYLYGQSDGRRRWFRISGQPLFGDSGEFGGYRGVGRDVTVERQALDELAKANAQLEQHNRQFDAAINNMSHGLSMFGRDRRLIVCNRRYVEMYSLPHELAKPGVIADEILRHRFASGIIEDPDQYKHIRFAIAAGAQPAEAHIHLRDGRVFTVLHHPIEGGGWVATHEDITERKRAEARIAHMARHDALTNLPNRTLFRERTEQAIARVKRGESSAVLCLDLDHFKAVNDTLGHPSGDALLKAVTERLQACVRDTDTVARLGGDEFAILQIGIGRPEEADILARRIIDTVSVPYELDGQQVVIGASIGIAIAPTDGLDPDELLKKADMALYKAKSDGRGTYHFFEAQMDAKQQARRALEVDLRKALVLGQFELFYQPIIDLASDQIRSAEALLRWRHPERGLVSPADFIPLCEEIGLIVPLGEWVLNQAYTEAAAWPEDIRIAVNLSPAQFRSRYLVQTVVRALANSGLRPDRLELEITESVLLLDSDNTRGCLYQLRDLGVRISMDDFGTGYSSLSYLRSFPFDKIKIDRSFVSELDEKDDCLAIVRAVAGLGASLRISTTAEGVETQEQLGKIRAEGCTEAQGYLFSPPVAAVQIRRFFDEFVPTSRKRA